MEPVSNLEDYICQKHERPLELFCRDDQMCVCLMCTVTDHKNHNTVPLEAESEEKKVDITNKTAFKGFVWLILWNFIMITCKFPQKTVNLCYKCVCFVRTMAQKDVQKIQDIKQSAEVRKVSLK